MPILNRVKAELGVNQATQCNLNSTKSSTITFSNSTAKISSGSFELLKMTNNKTRLWSVRLGLTYFEKVWYKSFL